MIISDQPSSAGYCAKSIRDSSMRNFKYFASKSSIAQTCIYPTTFPASM